MKLPHRLFLVFVMYMQCGLAIRDGFLTNLMSDGATERIRAVVMLDSLSGDDAFHHFQMIIGRYGKNDIGREEREAALDSLVNKMKADQELFIKVYYTVFSYLKNQERVRISPMLRKVYERSRVAHAEFFWKRINESVSLEEEVHILSFLINQPTSPNHTNLHGYFINVFSRVNELPAGLTKFVTRLSTTRGGFYASYIQSLRSEKSKELLEVFLETSKRLREEIEGLNISEFGDAHTIGYRYRELGKSILILSFIAETLGFLHKDFAMISDLSTLHRRIFSHLHATSNYLVELVTPRSTLSIKTAKFWAALQYAESGDPYELKKLQESIKKSCSKSFL